MPGSAERAALASTFAQASRTCEEAVTRHLGMRNTPPGALFSRNVTFAIGVLAATAEREVTVEDLRLVHDACADAAAVCRAQPPDAGVADAATCFALMAWTCTQALDVRAIHDGDARCRRFLFDDADLEVTRADGTWRIRVGNGVAEDKLLDRALSRLVGVPPRRLDELTLQILDWDARVRDD